MENLFTYFWWPYMNTTMVTSIGLPRFQRELWSNNYFHKGIRKFWYIWKLVMHTNISSKSMKCKFYSNESTGHGCEGTACRPTRSGPGCSFPPCWLRRAQSWVSLTGCPGSLHCSHPVSGWCKVQGLPPTSVGDVMVSFMCWLDWTVYMYVSGEHWLLQGPSQASALGEVGQSSYWFHPLPLPPWASLSRPWPACFILLQVRTPRSVLSWAPSTQIPIARVSHRIHLWRHDLQNNQTIPEIIYIFYRIENFLLFQMERWTVKGRTCVDLSKCYLFFKKHSLLFELVQAIEKKQNLLDYFYNASITLTLKVDQYIIKRKNCDFPIWIQI